MKTILAALLLTAATALPASAQAIGGHYRAEGTNINGSPYSGDVEITLTSDTTCVISWKTGATTSEGICSRNDDTFAAAYRMGDAVGLVIYKVAEDGSMDGLWTIAGEKGNGTEKLTPAE